MWVGASDDESVKALHRAFDLGLNFVDTALRYGDGHSEKLVGKAVKERSEKIYVATKVPPKNGQWRNAVCLRRKRFRLSMSSPAQKRVAESLPAESSGATHFPTHKTEPPTLVVDAFYRGDRATLTEALQAAKPGDRILVRPGLYQEGVVIEKPVEIIGDGDLGDVVIEAKAKNVVLFQTSMGRIANLTLRQAGGEGSWSAVDIAQGRLHLEACDITSQSAYCVGIHGGADPRLLRNRIHDGKDAGVAMYKNGQGTLGDNDIFANARAGVAISQGSNPTLRRNRIHGGEDAGVLMYENGQGTLEDNDIFANARAGVEIRTGANPSIRNNRISKKRAPRDLCSRWWWRGLRRQ